MKKRLEINYLEGDALRPKIAGKKMIIHICNDIGGWGRGFVVALSKRWKKPEDEYRHWYDENKSFDLGKVQFVEVEDDIIVANMIAQHNIVRRGGLPPIRYEALDKCLVLVGEKAQQENATIHMPRIGCGLAGGSWEEVERLIVKNLLTRNIGVYVYDLE